MRFGLESEKFLFDKIKKRPSNGVFRFIDAISDFELNPETGISHKITNEFVLNMAEIGTDPSVTPIEVIKEYFFNQLILLNVANRENVAVVSLGSLPISYIPHMTPKWKYFVQNSILDQKKQSTWMMGKNTPLRAAGNCAGIHIHSEITTPPEFLFSNQELRNKFNMSLMLTPMIAFSSSPYFFGKHNASCMRGVKYYGETYKKFPLNGWLPPVMNSSEEVLTYVKNAMNFWIKKGIGIGLNLDDLESLTLSKSANWNPVRWNRQWNTIELRCLDSDRIDFDCSKFVWVCQAMKRLDIKGEALDCVPIKTTKKVDLKMIDDCFEVSGKKVTILDSKSIETLFVEAMNSGTNSELVEAYLHKIAKFSSAKMEPEYDWAFQILNKALKTHNTTSQRLLELNKFRRTISDMKALELINYSINEQSKLIKLTKKYLPDVALRVEESCKKI